MAHCETGYFCRICGEYVEDITDSELYLRFVLGEVVLEELFYEADAHITCVPELAGLIDEQRFAPYRHRAAATGARPAERVTRAWQRLQEIPSLGIDIPDYPLPPDS